MNKASKKTATEYFFRDSKNLMLIFTSTLSHDIYIFCQLFLWTQKKQTSSAFLTGSMIIWIWILFKPVVEDTTLKAYSYIQKLGELFSALFHKEKYSKCLDQWCTTKYYSRFKVARSSLNLSNYSFIPFGGLFGSIEMCQKNPNILPRYTRFRCFFKTPRIFMGHPVKVHTYTIYLHSFFTERNWSQSWGYS